MSAVSEGRREGSLEAPTRHPIDWNNPEFYNEASLNEELERVFDICHGCRRCVSLCNAFPTLFDLVDKSKTMEVDGVDKKDYINVVDHCYLCDLCFLVKCPYVPPHEWNVDFPHLMLRAKAIKFKKGDTKIRDRLLTNTDMVSKLASIPVIVDVVNAVNSTSVMRKVLDSTLGVHPGAILPKYHSNTLRKRLSRRAVLNTEVVATETTKGKVALFTSCYGNYNEPQIGEDLVAILEHNGIPVTLVDKERCCGMPKLEVGDLDAVKAAKEANIPQLLKLVNAGWDIIAPIPSCVLMFKQELPLMFPDDDDVKKVQQAIFDPFEYLMLRHKANKLNTNFKKTLGKVSWHVACHQRVQRMGQKTREVLQLVPDTTVVPIERCSGHDGTYAVKSEYHEISMKIVRPVANLVQKDDYDHYGSDCPMASRQIENGIGRTKAPEHPLSLLRIAYGI